VAEAEQLAREAVSLSEPTDWPNLRADALLSLAEVLSIAGRSHNAWSAAERALAVYEQKGNVVSARRARSLLEELRETPARTP
jgi:hypothetical protein